jgi:hypothetical protein
MTKGENGRTTAADLPTEKNTETNRAEEKCAGTTGEKTAGAQSLTAAGMTGEKTVRKETILPVTEQTGTAGSFPVRQNPMKTGSRAAMP